MLRVEIPIVTLMPRLEPTIATLKRLFAVSGNKCAFHGCQRTLVTESGKLVVNVCHIEAAEPGGERINPNQTDEQRRDFANLILLCPSHHEETDDVDAFPVERLQQMKASHEKACEKLAPPPGLTPAQIKELRALAAPQTHIKAQRANVIHAQTVHYHEAPTQPKRPLSSNRLATT
jgi:hypothetical protein